MQAPVNRFVALLQRGALKVVVVALCVVALLLVRSNRTLRAELVKTRQRMVDPRALRFVPSFAATSISGDTLTIGARADSGKQLLFFLTTTCPYCRASLAEWKRVARSVDSVPGRPIAVYAVVLDSNDASV